VQRQTVNVVLALLIVASLLLVLAPSALSKGMNGHDWKGGKNGKAISIDETYSTIVVNASKPGATTYNVLNSAIKDKDGNVVVMNFTTPITGTYYSSNDTAIVQLPARNKLDRPHIKPVRTDYNNATISPAGGSAIIAKRNITVLKHDNKTFEFQFTGISVYLPDGSVKSYTLKTPVKVTMSRDTHTATAVGSPEFRADIQDALKGGAKFPANAAPVPLKKIDGK